VQAAITESTDQVPLPPILTSAADLLSRYDVLLCDVWGVVHDGRKAYPAANDALPRFRANGGTVVLVSNAPMTSPAVADLLDDKGVRRDAWDLIVPSGDIALSHIAEKGYKRIYGIGHRKRDASFFDAVPQLVESMAEADALACTGLADDRRETPEQYSPMLGDKL
jgi:ribonucleotide monophosphatase NagD (HAD superfamily)